MRTTLVTGPGCLAGCQRPRESSAMRCPQGGSSLETSWTTAAAHCAARRALAPALTMSGGCLTSQPAQSPSLPLQPLLPRKPMPRLGGALICPDKALAHAPILARQHPWRACKHANVSLQTVTHVAGREKDGLWAVLAWLSILAYRSSGGAKGKGNLGDKIAKFAPGGLLTSLTLLHFAAHPQTLQSICDGPMAMLIAVFIFKGCPYAPQKVSCAPCSLIQESLTHTACAHAER